MRRLIHGLAVLLLVSIGAGAGRDPIRSGSNGPQSTRGKKNDESTQTSHAVACKSFQVGAASWYGQQHDGKTTAIGEPFDMYDLTAAHATLPLGTIVRVTNLSNGKTVIVRVNDRGSFVKGRIIDVSYNAARVLDFVKKGVQRVRLDFEECPPEGCPDHARLCPNCPSYRTLAVHRISAICIIRRRRQRFSSTQ
jgi:rare lipoprotein A